MESKTRSDFVVTSAEKQGDGKFAVFAATAMVAGVNKNRVLYSEEVLSVAVRAGLFEGVPVYNLSDWKHGMAEADVNYLLGFFGNAEFKEGKVVGKLSLLKSNPTTEKITAWLAVQKEGVNVDRSIPKLSIVTLGPLEFIEEQGSTIIKVTSIEKVLSVDVVMNAAAGGQIENLLAASEKETREMPDVGIREMQDQLAATQKQIEALQNQTVANAAMALTEKLLASALTLPEHFKNNVREKVLAAVEKKTAVTEENVQKLVDDERNALASVVESKKETIAVGLESVDKWALGLERFFVGDDPALTKQKISSGDAGHDWKGIPALRSVRKFVEMAMGREIYEADNLWQKLPRGIPMQRMNPDGTLANTMLLESLPEIFENVLNKRMLREYWRPDMQAWRGLTQITPLVDLKPQARYRFGGFGELPTVLEGGEYTDLGNLVDEDVNYTPTKKGGTASITIEMLINDDLRVMSRIAPKLGDAAVSTINTFVETFITGNAAVYDDVALFDATHSNLGTAALSQDSLEAAWVAMMSQTETVTTTGVGSTTRRLNVTPDIVMFSPTNMRTADHIVRPAVNMYNDSADFLQRLGLRLYLMKTLTDLDAWYLMANPSRWDTIEIGFLGGKDAPTLITQRGETEGQMFSNDRITYKMRWFWGGAVTEYRTMYAGIPE